MMEHQPIRDAIAPLRAEQLDLAAQRTAINARLSVLHGEITALEVQLKQATASIPDPMAGVIVAEPAGIMPMEVVEPIAPIAPVPMPQPKAFAPRVSDHAVLRYLERASGMDFAAVRHKLLTPNVVAAMKAGARAVKVDGGRLIIKDDTVVTFAPKDPHQGRTPANAIKRGPRRERRPTRFYEGME